MIIKVAGHEYCVTNKPKRHSKSLSLGSISDIGIEVEKTKMEKTLYTNINNNNGTMECKNNTFENDKQCRSDKETVYNKDIKSMIIDLVDAKPPDTKILLDRNFSEIARNERESTKKIQERKPVKNQISINTKKITNEQNTDVQNSIHVLSKSKSEGNPFQHRKKGKVVKVNRPITSGKHTYLAWCDMNLLLLIISLFYIY